MPPTGGSLAWPSSAGNASIQTAVPPASVIGEKKGQSHYRSSWGGTAADFKGRCGQMYQKASRRGLIKSNYGSFHIVELYVRKFWVHWQGYRTDRNLNYAEGQSPGYFYYDTFYGSGGMLSYPSTYRSLSYAEANSWRGTAQAVLATTPTGAAIVNNAAATGATGTTTAGRNAVTDVYVPSMSADRLESYTTALKQQMQTAKDAILKTLPASFYSGSADSISARIDQTLKAELAKRGFTQAEVAWFLSGGRVNPITGGGSVPASTRPSASSGTGNGGTTDPTTPFVPVPVTTRVKIKAPFGYIKPPTSRSGRPHIYQTYPAAPDYKGALPDSGASPGQALTEIFYFPYTPSNIQYSGLGSTWTELPRVGDFPIVEWSNYNLLKVSFEFLVAADRTEPGGAVVPDGMFIHVENELDKLRRMAQRPYPVSVFGMDDMLRIAIRRAAETGRPLEFVIADLQVNAIRRTSDSSRSRIAAASVKLTLQEKPIEQVRVADFKLPVIPPKLPPPTKKKTTPTNPVVIGVSEQALAGPPSTNVPIPRPRPSLGQSVPW